MNLKKYIKELKRRNVLKAGLAYLVIAWLVIQVASIILPTFNAPQYILKTILFILIIGFPIWIVFSWVYEITPEGIKKTQNVNQKTSISAMTNNRLNKVIIITLSIVILVLLYNQFRNSESIAQDNSQLKKLVLLDKKSIAVLPFVDMSPNSDQQYLGDGLAKEILNLISKASGLKVISQSSCFQFKGTNMDAREIGQKLGVNFMVEGSVQKFKDKIRINAQLIDTKDGSQIWSKDWDRVFNDLFIIQDEIAESISTQLQTSLGLRKEINERGTNNVQAYDYYLRGDNIDYEEVSINKDTTQFYFTERMFLKAIELDSTFVDAHAGLSNLYDVGIDLFPTDSTMEKKSWQEIDIAYRINPNSSEVNYVKGELYRTLSESDKNLYYWKKAIELDPYKSSRAFGRMAGWLEADGLLYEAEELLEIAIAYNPLKANLLGRRAFYNYFMGKIDDSEMYYIELLSMGEENRNGFLCRLNCFKGNIELAEMYFNKFVESGVPESSKNYYQAFIYAAKGDQRATDLLRSSEILLILGNYDEWYDYMDAFFERNPNRCYYHQLSILPEQDPKIHKAFFDRYLPLRDHPRYPAMLASQKKRYEYNFKRLSVRNSILKSK